MVKTKSYPQLKYIFLLAKKCGMSTDNLRFTVKENFPDTDGHLSRLTSYQALILINTLKRILNQGDAPGFAGASPEDENYRLGRQPRDSIRPPMSQAQHDTAFQLAHEIKGVVPGSAGATPETPTDLLEKLARHHGSVCFDTCTTRQAFRVICALKSIKHRLCH